MFGLTFLEPLFLLGLLAAPLPILIHLFQRRRARLVPWSSLEFVRALQRPRTRRLDLRRLLLLAMRVLAILLLALALARPVLPGGSAGADAPSDAVIVLDASLSMGARSEDGAGTLFEAGRRKAAGVLDLLRSGDRAALLLAGDSNAPQPLLTDDLDALRERLADAQPGKGRLSWAETVARAGRILAASHGANREMYLVSDFQASGWEEPIEALGALEREGVRGYLLPAGTLPAGNLALEAVRVTPIAEDAGADPAAGAAPGARTRLRMRALVRNHGLEPADDVGVQFLADGADPVASVVSVGAQEAAWASAETELSAGGASGSSPAYTGRVEIAADALPGDDVRFFAAAPAEPTRVLLVGRPNAEEPGRLTTHYLRRSLAPADSSRAFELRELAAADLTAADLGDVDVVVLADVERVGPGALDALRRRVEGGTGLFVFTGPGTDVGFMNQTFLPDFLDLQLEGLSGEHAVQHDFAWGTTDARHPIFRVFGASGSGDALSRARFTDALRALPGEGTRLVASFTNGLPALLEGHRGDGRVLVFTSSPDLSWGNFPMSGNFVPFVHESVIHLAHGREGPPPEYAVGEVVSREIPAGLVAGAPAEGAGFVLVTPAGVQQPVVPQPLGRRTALPLGGLGEEGIYRLERGGRMVDAFAVNADPRESSLPCLDADEAAQRLRPLATVSGSGGDSFARAVYAARYGREISTSLLWAALLLLIAELAVRGSFIPPRALLRHAASQDSGGTT